MLIAAVILAVRIATREAAFERARLDKGTLIFSPVLTVQIAVVLGAPLFLYAALVSAVSVRATSDLWLPILFLAFVVLLLVSWPGSIQVDHNGVACRRLVGGTAKQISWESISSVFQDRSAKIIRVCSKDGIVIEHGMYHRDPVAFLAAVKEHVDARLTRNN